MTEAAARVRRDGDALVFEGRLDRAAAAALWRSLPASTAGIRRLDLHAVETVDSAGVALLAELAARLPGVDVHGDPGGLAALRAAYRLGATLDFAA